MDVQPPPPPQSNRYKYVILFCIVIGLLYYFISPHYENIVLMINTMRSMTQMISSLYYAMKTPPEEGSNIVNTKNPTPPKKTPDPNESSSSIQGSTIDGGYCYVGEWKGVRSCVKVDKTTPCKTQLYSTEELCVNPTLRP
jgi:hypothetical protein